MIGVYMAIQKGLPGRQRIGNRILKQRVYEAAGGRKTTADN